MNATFSASTAVVEDLATLIVCLWIMHYRKEKKKKKKRRELGKLILRHLTDMSARTELTLE
jgi:hypothetical protein